MNKLFSVLLCLALLLGLAGCGAAPADQSPSLPNSQLEALPQSESVSAPAASKTPEPAASQLAETEEEDEFDVADVSGAAQDFSKYEEVEKDIYFTSPVPEGQPQPVEPGTVEIDRSSQKTCYLTISCSTILNNMENLTEGKEVLVPSDGLILPRTEVVFYEGESVFDLLQRETKNQKIHLESSFTPMYNSAYIEGIGNLYEFDCGSESGWQYRVNGWFPNYGVSRYLLQSGDEVEFLYTCDLGRDLGADWMDAQ